MKRNRGNNRLKHKSLLKLLEKEKWKVNQEGNKFLCKGDLKYLAWMVDREFLENIDEALVRCLTIRGLDDIEGKKSNELIKRLKDAINEMKKGKN